MRDLRVLLQFKTDHPFIDNAYMVPFRGRDLRVIATTHEGWDHVSVSLPNRTPNWDELEHVKRLFFKDDEWAMQLHAPPAEHVNVHPHCLHMWRPQYAPIPRPDARLVL